MFNARLLFSAIVLSISFSPIAQATTYVKLADEWGTIQPAGPRTGNNGIRAWNIEGLGASATFASSGTLRFYMSDLVSQLNTAFPGGWQVNKVTLVLEHNDAAFSAAGGVNVFHFTDDTVKITSGLAAPTTDLPPNDFTALGASTLKYSDTATSGGQLVRVLDDTSEANLGTVTKVGSYTFTVQGDQNLDVIANSNAIVDPAGAIDAAPAYGNDFPSANPDDTLAVFTTEQTTDLSELSGAATIISDVQAGADSLSFIFTAKDDNSSVAATYQGNPFNQTTGVAGMLFQPRIYLDVTGVAGLTGDYNGDGKVNSQDYVVWRKTGINGAQGYTDWRSNFGNGGLGAGASVPEPTSAVLLVIGLVAFCSRRRSA
jgi:hypothetical protein